MYRHIDTVVTSPVNVLSQLYRKQENKFVFFFGFFSRKNRLLSFCLGTFFVFVLFFYDFYCMLKNIKFYIVMYFCFFVFVFLFWMQQTMQMSVRLSALLEGLFVCYILYEYLVSSINIYVKLSVYIYRIDHIRNTFIYIFRLYTFWECILYYFTMLSFSMVCFFL